MWPLEVGVIKSNVVTIFRRAAHFEELTTEPTFRLQKVGGNI